MPPWPRQTRLHTTIWSTRPPWRLRWIGRKGRTGVGQARRLLRLADGRAESAGESAVRWAIARVGLPAPDLQVVVRDHAGTFLGRVDFAYPDVGVIIEFDGEVKYRNWCLPARPPGRRHGRTPAREAYAGGRFRRHPDRLVRSSRSCGAGRRIREALARGRRAVAAGLITGTMTVSAGDARLGRFTRGRRANLGRSATTAVRQPPTGGQPQSVGRVAAVRWRCGFVVNNDLDQGGVTVSGMSIR